MLFISKDNNLSTLALCFICSVEVICYKFELRCRAFLVSLGRISFLAMVVSMCSYIMIANVVFFYHMTRLASLFFVEMWV